MAETLVWAFQPLEELNGETGFVACEEELAKELIAADKAQDPAHGALHLKEIQYGDYQTKEMKPAKKKVVRRKKKTTSDEEE